MYCGVTVLQIFLLSNGLVNISATFLSVLTNIYSIILLFICSLMKLILVFIILVLFSVRRVLHSSIAALLSIYILIGASIATCKSIYNSNIYNISCTITSSAFTSLSQDDLESSLSLRLILNIAAHNLIYSYSYQLI